MTGLVSRDKFLFFSVWIGLLLAVAGLPSSASAQTIDWIRQFGSNREDFAHGIDVDSTGVYIVGSTRGTLSGQNSAGNSDSFICKYDAGGNLLWTHQFGTDGSDGAYGVEADPIGVYVVGGTQGTLPGQNSAGGEDAYVRKYDVNGNVIWTRQFGFFVSGAPANDYALRVATTANSIYVAGVTSINYGPRDVFLVKFDGDGNLLWMKQFVTTGSDDVTGIAVDSSGIYISGPFLNAKFDGEGNEVWRVRVGASGIAVDNTGVYFIGGSSAAYLWKYDTNGNLVWSRQLGQVGHVAPEGVTTDSTGIYVGGEEDKIDANEKDAFVRRYDAIGNERWTRQFGTAAHDESVTGIAVDTTAVYLVGYTFGGAFPGQTYSGGFWDAYLVKLKKDVPPPVVFDGGVVNNASYVLHPAPVAPGSIAAIFGSDLTYGSVVLVPNFSPEGKLVTNLGETSVTVNNIPAPLFYSTPVQLGIQIPTELAGQTSATIQVKVGTQTSIPQTIFLDTFAPGIFTLNQQGTGMVAALHQSNSKPVMPDNPARPGEIIELFATGLGPVSPPLGTGERSTGRRPTATPTTVTIDGIPAIVDFSAIQGIFSVGLYQINIHIPANARSAMDIPVVVSIGGKQSNQVTIPIAP